jgi:hypothetical protein
MYDLISCLFLHLEDIHDQARLAGLERKKRVP